MTTLIIARHGNTFEDGEPPRRVGARTDLPLTEKGRAQAAALGRHLKKQNLLPDANFCSALQRARETAQLARAAMGLDLPLQIEPFFNEIDYGPDENKPEADVITRIGAPALAAWEDENRVPPGWLADPPAIIEGWQNFAARMAAEHASGTILIVTSNGIARFAPQLAASCAPNRPLKLATGAFGILKNNTAGWVITHWNEKP